MTPASPRIPVAEVRPGVVVGGWKVLRDGLAVKGGLRGVLCESAGGGRSRVQVVHSVLLLLGQVV